MDSRNLELAVKLRHELHHHPEVSNEEKWTKAHIMKFLSDYSDLELVDRGRWFYAIYKSKNSGRRIAFRADIDALPIDETISLPYGSVYPGVSHKCGHDGHSASLAAFALEVEERGCNNDIYFIFQHAEETGDGAKACAVLIDEEGIDEVFGYHNEPGYPLGEVIVNDGSFQCASKGMSIFFKGEPSHASDPGVGRNPAMAIARMIRALPDLHKAEDYKGLVLSTVVHTEIGSNNFGTSASNGVLRITIRGQFEEEMDLLEKRIDALSYGLASEYGLDYSKEFSDYFPENSNHQESAQKVRDVCLSLGIKTHEFPNPKRGSEDFGYYTKATKGAYFNIGAGDITSHHTIGYDFPDDIIGTAVEVFYGLACIE
ncbi:MAG: amidohydrolase [Tissierellia bacterium]|nr:amidohydrolase [Tissierellia bacterium]